jgi:acetoin utilization protein AcuB
VPVPRPASQFRWIRNFTTSPDTPLADVVETMLERKLGSAVVIDHDHVVGVFTTVDALRALRELLAA